MYIEGFPRSLPCSVRFVVFYSVLVVNNSSENIFQLYSLALNDHCNKCDELIISFSYLIRTERNHCFNISCYHIFRIQRPTFKISEKARQHVAKVAGLDAYAKISIEANAQQGIGRKDPHLRKAQVLKKAHGNNVFN